MNDLFWSDIGIDIVSQLLARIRFFDSWCLSIHSNQSHSNFYVIICIKVLFFGTLKSNFHNWWKLHWRLAFCKHYWQIYYFCSKFWHLKTKLNLASNDFKIFYLKIDHFKTILTILSIGVFMELKHIFYCTSMVY